MGTVVAYGRCIESDFPFNALPLADPAATVKPIRVTVERVSHIERDTGVVLKTGKAQGRDIRLVFRESYITVQIDLILSCLLYPATGKIECSAISSITDDVLQYWILQHILPLSFFFSGSMEFLHGAAVSAFPSGASSSQERKGIAFLGDSLAGKSTLLGYFLKRGHALLTDDHLPLSRQDYTVAFPALPYYRPYRASESLGVVAEEYSPEPACLERIYLLRPVRGEKEVRVKRLSGLEAITWLYPSLSYTLYNPEKPDFFPLVEDRFHGLADITRRVPIAHLYVPRAFNRLPEVYDRVQADLSAGIGL